MYFCWNYPLCGNLYTTIQLTTTTLSIHYLFTNPHCYCYTPSSFCCFIQETALSLLAEYDFLYMLYADNTGQQRFCPTRKNVCFWCIFGCWIQICFQNFSITHTFRVVSDYVKAQAYVCESLGVTCMR